VSGVAREVVLSSYTATIEEGALDRVGDVVRAHAAAHRYAIVTDSNVAPLYAGRVCDALGADRTHVEVIPAGEEYKTRDSWASVTDAMLAAGMGRDTTVIALGGGVVGDLAGFVAATFMRGVPFVQVPTSLLAMIDASIGGKTGVDTPAGKNLVGVFHQPAAVLVDPSVLATLPPVQLRAGLAEALKHGVIADAGYFESVARFAARLGARALAGAGDELTELVARSIAIKAAIVLRDEREGGIRKTLNFGHTLGHAIESCSAYRILHGEAVAMGMVLESELAERLGVAESGTAGAVHAAVQQSGLPVARPAALAADDVLRATRSDKKARAGHVEYALPSRIGAMAGEDRGWALPVEDDLVRDVLR
jgi:3-dehydroquinate synthase